MSDSAEPANSEERCVFSPATTKFLSRLRPTVLKRIGDSSVSSTDRFHALVMLIAIDRLPEVTPISIDFTLSWDLDGGRGYIDLLSYEDECRESIDSGMGTDHASTDVLVEESYDQNEVGNPNEETDYTHDEGQSRWFNLLQMWSSEPDSRLSITAEDAEFNLEWDPDSESDR